MDRSEPSLVPEWLKNGGSVTGGCTTAHQFPASSLHSDDRAVPKPIRNKSSVNISDNDTGRSSVADRATSSYFRKSSSSNGSAHSRSYNSFGRSHHDRNQDKDIYDSRDKEKSILGDHKHRDYSDPLWNILPSRCDKESLRCSQSMISGKREETWPRNVATDLGNFNKNNHSNGNGLLGGCSPISCANKSAFERDFPSLGAEERQAATGIGRVTSPGLTTAIQSLPIGALAMIGCDKWTSALAEVPAIVGSNVTSGLSVQLAGPMSSASGASSTTTGFNMAETLVQGPPRAQTIPQLSVETQRLEELAIKQSRQLIPLTPTMPKALVLNPLEKPKPKVGHQQHQISSHPVNLSPRGVPVKSDVSKTSNVGKLHVLKPARERNGVSAAKDSLSPTSGSKVANSSLAIAPLVVSAPLQSSGNNPALASVERKPALEKRPTPQAQSRNDFFNLMRKKSLTSYSSVVADSGPAVSPSSLDKPGETEAPAASATQNRGVTDVPSPDSFTSNQSIENGGELTSHGAACDGPQKSLNGKNHCTFDTILYSEEEEAAFLRSLGWEESAGEDEGLTEEEISAFYRDVNKYVNSSLHSKIFQGMQTRFLLPLNSQMGSAGGISSGLGSSDSELES